MILDFINYILGLFKRKPVRLAIVRKYTDANGSYVGELYIEQERYGVSSYNMIGVSLDTLPLEMGAYSFFAGKLLDVENDFLAPMPKHTVRVGALIPEDNDKVRKMIAKLPKRRITLLVQNRFIEHVIGKKV